MNPKTDYVFLLYQGEPHDSKLLGVFEDEAAVLQCAETSLRGHYTTALYIKPMEVRVHRVTTL